MKCVHIRKIGITQSTSIFSNDECMMLQNHAGVKSFEMKANPMTFNVTEYRKVIDTVSDFTLQ